MDKEDSDICDGDMSQEDMGAVDEGQSVGIGEKMKSETECEAVEFGIGEERQTESECEAVEVIKMMTLVVRDAAGGHTDVELEPTLSDMSETKLAKEFVVKRYGSMFLKREQCCK